MNGKVCTCWRLRPDGAHGKGCAFYRPTLQEWLDARHDPKWRPRKLTIKVRAKRDWQFDRFFR